MKRTMKIILSLACVVALIASLGVGALAYTDQEIAQIASNAQRALDVQAVENIMNRHVMYHCYGEHRENSGSRSPRTRRRPPSARTRASWWATAPSGTAM